MRTVDELIFLPALLASLWVDPAKVAVDVRMRGEGRGGREEGRMDGRAGGKSLCLLSGWNELAEKTRQDRNWGRSHSTDK